MKSAILLTAILMNSLISTAGPLPARVPVSFDLRTSFKADPVFNAFRAHRQGSGITTMWFSNATPSYVTCFTVIRTYEDPTDPYAEWAVVSVAACNSSRNYRHTDMGVSPGFVSYRIVATLASGGYAYSDIETVHIVRR